MSRARPTDKRLWLVVGGAATALVAWLVVLVWFWQLGLSAEEQVQLGALLHKGMGLLLLGGAVGLGVLAWALNQAHALWVRGVAQLSESVQIAVNNLAYKVPVPERPSDLFGLAMRINALQQQRMFQQQAEDERVFQVSQDIAQERNRLAALMSELTQSVVVCNLDGTVLLYNNRARLQFKVMGDGGGESRLGLGRSIYDVVDQALVTHALDSVRNRLGKGVQQPSAQFVTATRAGQLLKVQLAPVRLAGDGQGQADPQVSGFVLMVDNITREQEQAQACSDLIWRLTEGARASMANLRAAVEVAALPDVPPDLQGRLQGVIREEVLALNQRMLQTPHGSVLQALDHWSFEDILGADFLDALALNLQKKGGVRLAPEPVAPDLWLRLDSYALLSALGGLVQRLSEGRTGLQVTCRLAPLEAGSGLAELELCWPAAGAGSVPDPALAMALAAEQGAHQSAQRFADIIERHGGSFWLTTVSGQGALTLRLQLPVALPPTINIAESPVWLENRPEFYDFDLFRQTPSALRLEDRLLSDLVYTVFDTETTGLNPSGGDEIIQIGASRIVNGRIRVQENFEQLVNPRRHIPAHTIPIHGITPGMVVDQPTIDRVLPRFHHYAQGSVLVAHNAAFDMRFLQLKEKDCGVVFDQPVLDTLLLSALVHPQQDSHRLEAIASRFNVAVIGRHTAGGDAYVTAQVFLHMLPLLANKGIHTLGQALEASRKTYFSRIQYH